MRTTNTSQLTIQKKVPAEALRNLFQTNLGPDYSVYLARTFLQKSERILVIRKSIFTGCGIRISYRKGKTKCRPYALIPLVGLSASEITTAILIAIFLVGIRFGHIVLIGIIPFFAIAYLTSLPSLRVLKDVREILSRSIEEIV